MASSPAILVASGLDPSGGAGLVADIRVAERCGVRPIAVVTALTVQDTSGLRRSVPVDPELLGEQIACILSDVEVGAVKIGLVGDVAGARELARGLALTGAPVVWDPVVAATAGGPMAADPLDALAEILAPEATLITPNLDEAAAIGEPDCAVLVKGGHADGGDEVIDVLTADGASRELCYPRVPGPPIHGTGCFLSTAIACELALGRDLDAAVDAARARLARRLLAPVSPGRGARAIL